MPPVRRLVRRNPVVREILRQGRRQPRGKRRRYSAAALTIGRVEKNYEDTVGGDADSSNWRQERASVYGDEWARTGGPTNTRASVRRVFRELRQHDRGQPIGELAADVQRPAAPYRGRYQQALPEAKKILRVARKVGVGPGAPGGGRGGGRVFQPGRVDLSRVSSFDQEGFEQATQRARVGQFLAERRGTHSILFRSGLLSTSTPDRGEFTSTQLQSKMTPGRMVGAAGGTGDAAPSSGQVATAVRSARKRLGITEVNGSNRGPQVDRMQKRFGMIGQPWCGIFVGTALKRAGVQGVTSRVASVAAIEQDAKQGANGFRSWHGPRQAQRGDALVTASGQHVGLVVGVDRKRGIIRTIEGNTGNGEVARRTHRMDSVHGVARPRYRRKR